MVTFCLLVGLGLLRVAGFHGFLFVCKFVEGDTLYLVVFRLGGGLLRGYYVTDKLMGFDCEFVALL